MANPWDTNTGARYGANGYWNRQLSGRETGRENAVQQARSQGYGGTIYEAPEELMGSPAGTAFAKRANILQSGFSGQQQGTTDYQDALRSAAMGRINQIGSGDLVKQQKQALTTDLERGFENQAAMLRRSAAGTGAGASLGYGRAAGDLANQFQQNLGKSLLSADMAGREQDMAELSGLGGVGQQLFAQELANRQQMYNQAQDLSNVYGSLQDMESGREGAAAQQAAEATAARKAAQNSLIQSLLGAGGYIGGMYASKK